MTAGVILGTLALLALSYIAGSIPTGLWLGLRLRGIDIRQHGSQNIGATNTLRVLGKKLGAIALLCDVLKGALPVAAASMLAPQVAALPVLCGVAAILGHTFSLFLRFSGGKGVATSAGVFLALAPLPTLAGLYAFALIVTLTQTVSAASVAAAATMAVFVLCVPQQLLVTLMTVVVAALVIYKHRSNLGRLYRGEESRMWDAEKHRAPLRAANSLWLPVGTDIALAVIVALGALAVYLCTLARGVTGEDSGNFITAAYNLGIPHPPGYPLYTLVAHLFTLLPIGGVAARVALDSAMFAAGAAGFTALLIVMFTRNRWAAALGAFMLAFSFEFWKQAVIAEVYGMNAFLFAISLYLVFQWRALAQHGTPCNRPLYALAVVCGLAQGVHNAMTVIAPLLALYVLCVDRSPRRFRRYAVLCVIAVATGCAVFLYLIIRAQSHPVPNWGNPDTWQRFVDVVRRKQFAFMVTQYPHTFPRFLAQLNALVSMTLQQFAPWNGIVALFGLGFLAGRRRAEGLLLLGISVVLPVTFALVQNFGTDKEWLWIMAVFNLPVYLCLAIGFATLLAALHERIPHPGGRAALLAAALVAVALPWPGHAHANDKSQFSWVDDYGRNVLNSLEKDAIWVPEMDHQSFSAMYWQQVRGLRKDVALMRTYGYVDLSLVRDMPRERLDDFGPFPPLDREPEIFSWLLAHTQRPVYFSEYPKLADPAAVRIVPWGLVFRVLRPGETDPPGDPWDAYRWRLAPVPANTRGDFTAELMLAEFAMRHAETEYRAGNAEAAHRFFEQAIGAFGEDAALLNNMSRIAARYQDWTCARAFLERAVALAPEDETLRKNLERAQAAP